MSESRDGIGYDLKTERLLLREMKQADFPALCRMLQDPEIMYAYAHAFEDWEIQNWLDRQLIRYREDGFALWAVIRSDTGEMIGQCGLTWQDCNGRRALEVGYLLKKGSLAPMLCNRSDQGLQRVCL